MDGRQERGTPEDGRAQHHATKCLEMNTLGSGGAQESVMKDVAPDNAERAAREDAKMYGIERLTADPPEAASAYQRASECVRADTPGGGGAQGVSGDQLELDTPERGGAGGRGLEVDGPERTAAADAVVEHLEADAQDTAPDEPPVVEYLELDLPRTGPAHQPCEPSEEALQPLRLEDLLAELQRPTGDSCDRGPDRPKSPKRRRPNEKNISTTNKTPHAVAVPGADCGTPSLTASHASATPRPRKRPSKKAAACAKESGHCTGAAADAGFTATGAHEPMNGGALACHGTAACPSPSLPPVSSPRLDAYLSGLFQKDRDNHELPYVSLVVDSPAILHDLPCNRHNETDPRVVREKERFKAIRCAWALSGGSCGQEGLWMRDV